MKLKILHEDRYRIIYDMVIKYLEDKGYDIKVDVNWILFRAPQEGYEYLGWIEHDIRNGMLYGNYYDRMGEKVTIEWQPSDPELLSKITAFADRLHDDASDFEVGVYNADL